MRIVSEISLENFEAWSGAIDTLDRIRNAGKCDILESILEEEYPDGISKTGLNDILWFEPDWCYEMCGMRTESEIREELEEEAPEEDWHNGKLDCKKQELWQEEYFDDASELTEKIAELEEELEDW